MANTDPAELQRAREEARRAREESQRMRDEAHRLREQARELERRLRDEERRAREREREERRRNRPPGSPPDFPFGTRGGPHHRSHFGPGPESPDLDGDGGEPITLGTRADHGFSLDGIREVVLDQTAGKVLLRYCRDDEEPGVTTYGNKSTPNLEVVRTDDRVVITVQISTGWLFRRRQGQSTVVRLQPGLADLRVDLGAGEVEVRGVETQKMNLSVGAGEVKCLGTGGNVDASVGAGKISLQAHRGLARGDVGTGDLRMDIAGVEAGEYRGTAGMGRVEVRLAPGHPVHIRATSRIGKSRIQYPDAGEGAPTRVRVDSGIGEATVTARGSGEEPTDAEPRAAAGSKPQREGRSEANRRRRESEELRVLQMLEQGKISASEAADLIAALQGMSAVPDSQPEPLENPASVAAEAPSQPDAPDAPGASAIPLGPRSQPPE